MIEFQLKDIYSLVSLIDGSICAGVGFWAYDTDIFANASMKFSRETVLHHYIVTRALSYYRKDFRKNGDCIEEEEIEHWASLFESYDIKIPTAVVLQRRITPYRWIEIHEDKFICLFERMAEEAFYILFSNRNFLLKFNEIVAEAVQDTEYPKNALTKKGTLRRRSIPVWVQNAAYHRDKGRCVYCNTDLTNTTNLLTTKNYDHMVPLDLYGANDPCNIQLTCEPCNKSKSNKEASTSFRYQPWWKNK